MRAFHSFWSVPNSVRSGGQIEFPDYEIMTMILSALKWQACNGPITMVTDTPGAAYFESIGLTGLWNTITTGLDIVDNEVDPILFWAAGKLFALCQMELPCAMLDTDLIIWKKLTGVEEQEIVAAHYEELYPEVYPDPSRFPMESGYTFPKEWNFELPAANTAFLYLRDEKFRNRYVEEAVAFLRSFRMDGHPMTEEVNPVTAMCFAEQRILPMCARSHGKEIGYLLDIRDPNAQSIATHSWGFKDVMRRSEEAREEFCIRCAVRILKDHPEREELLMGREDLRRYLLAARALLEI